MRSTRESSPTKVSQHPSSQHEWQTLSGRHTMQKVQGRRRIRVAGDKLRSTFLFLGGCWLLGRELHGYDEIAGPMRMSVACCQYITYRRSVIGGTCVIAHIACMP